MTAIVAMIEETESWRAAHRAARRHIEAAACAIRLKALRDVLAAIEEDRP
jgi:hypothetical protein